MPTSTEKKQAEQAAKIAKEGRFAALEDEDNSIDVSNEAYIGVDPEYRNSAEYDGVALGTPLDSEEEDPVADRVKASAEELTNLTVNRAGHTVTDQAAGFGIKVDPDAGGKSRAEIAAQAPGVIPPEGLVSPEETPEDDEDASTNEGGGYSTPTS